VAAVDERDHLHEDEIVAAVRTRGSLPLPLDGWDQASVWGWDETTGSLYARLWRNTDHPAKQPAIQIGPDDYTSTITCDAMLAQQIAMAVDCDPWTVFTALDDAAGLNENDPPADNGGPTTVGMTEGYSPPGWPYRQQC
jgi:hypothetical protein